MWWSLVPGLASEQPLSPHKGLITYFRQGALADISHVQETHKFTCSDAAWCAGELHAVVSMMLCRMMNGLTSHVMAGHHLLPMLTVH